MAARGDGEVRAVGDPAEFAALRDAWDALTARGRIESPFMSHVWFDAAWQWRRETATLFVLCLSSGNRLDASLPLVLARRQVAGMATRELAFLTVPDTQHCDVVVADEDRAAAAAALAGSLDARRSEWDVLRLDYLRPESCAATDLRTALAGHGYHVRVEPAAENPYVSLEATWDAYYGTRSRRLKKANNLAANRLRRLGNAEVHWLEPGTGTEDDALRATEDACAISARSWKSSTGNSLDNPGPGAFIRRLSERAHRRGWLSVWLLRLDGVPIAMEYQLVAGRCVYALRSDFDAGIEEQASPGSYLSRHLIERLSAGACRAISWDRARIPTSTGGTRAPSRSSA
jgi:CelD/BcsL family acetyltransferase involved in cellulose biosynthesis